MELESHASFSEVYEWIGHALNDYGGIIVVDARNKIQFISPLLKTYLTRTWGNDLSNDALEKFALSSGIRQVIETGMPQLGRPWHIGSQELVTFQLPAFQDKQLVGAVLLIAFKQVEAIFHHKQGFGFPQAIKNPNIKYSFDSIIGNSLAIVKAKRVAWDIATTNFPAFIFGETGTGKELFAHAIHNDSNRNKGPFITINCAGIPDSLIESELFGYEAGAFTGAKAHGKPGKFEMADGGTLFLAEISELSYNSQAKLLRFLEQREIERVGGTTVKTINVRIISACNADLRTAIKQGTFREDLYYRLNVFSVRVPPLRERLEDVAALSFHFITRFNQESDTNVTALSKEALAKLMSHDWPGNVRELKNTVQKACLHAKVGLIRPEDIQFINSELLPDDVNVYDIKERPNLKEARLEAERKVILDALEETGGNKTKACQLLNLSRTTFYKKLKELELT
ncbi:MAG: sigma 54-interacting transcriptional regulator [Syntrophomonadaceae bacterium]|nr:sigma 54-interacting transcriptional regulator [Syntrophomonadaceae bacterium]